MPEGHDLSLSHIERLAALGEQMKILSQVLPKIEKIYDLSFRGHAQNEEILRRLDSGDRQFHDLATTQQMHHTRLTSVEGTISGRDNLPGLAQKVEILATAHAAHRAQVRFAAFVSSAITTALGLAAALGTFVLGFWHPGKP